MERSVYDKFLADASAVASENPGETVFASAGCGACHEFTPAGTDSQVGPSLDAIQPTGGKPLEEFIRESIVEPDAVIAAGFRPDVMPKTFNQTLSDDQLDDLVQYLVDGQKGSK